MITFLLLSISVSAGLFFENQCSIQLPAYHSRSTKILVIGASVCMWNLKLRGGAERTESRGHNTCYINHDPPDTTLAGDSDDSYLHSPVSQGDAEDLSTTKDGKSGIGYIHPHGYNFPPFDDGSWLHLPEDALGPDNATAAEVLDLCKVMGIAPDKLGNVDSRDLLDAAQGRSRIVKEYYRQRLVRRPNGKLVSLARIYADIFRRLDEVHNLQVLRRRRHCAPRVERD